MKIYPLDGFKHILSKYGEFPALLGLDYGTRRIGIGISVDGLNAYELATYNRHPTAVTKDSSNNFQSTSVRMDYNSDEAMIHASKFLSRIVQAHNVKGIVVGYPLLHDGSPSKLCPEIVSFMQRLQIDPPIQTPLFPCVGTIWNENGSTVIARAHIRSFTTRKAVAMKKKDSVAAAIILQSFLNHYHKRIPIFHDDFPDFQ